MTGNVILQTEALINHIFPAVNTEELDIDGVIEWGRKAVYIEERLKINMQRAIVDAFGSDED